MSVIWTPDAISTGQPTSEAVISPRWKDSVLSASLGGRFYNLVTDEFQEISGTVVPGANQGGVCDVPSGSSQGVIESATPGLSFLILCSFSPQGLSGIKQIIAYDDSLAGGSNRVFQLRTNGTNLDFIRFNTGPSAASVSLSLGIPQGGFGTIVAWVDGAAFGIITPTGESSSSVSPPMPWNAAGSRARWYQRSSGGIANEVSSHQSALRAVLVDPGSQEVRRELRRNPWQIFKPQSRTIFLPALSALTLTSITPTTGPSTGGTTVTIYGSGFLSGTPEPRFNGVLATDVAVVNDGELTCVTPAL